MTGKEKMLNHCVKTLRTTSVEYLEKCQDVKIALGKDNISLSDLSDCGCPNNFGLNGKGLCETVKVSPREQANQCKECWEIALQ